MRLIIARIRFLSWQAQRELCFLIVLYSVWEIRQSLGVWESFVRDVRARERGRQKDCVSWKACQVWKVDMCVLGGMSVCVCFFFSKACSVGMRTMAVASRDVWLGGTEPDSRQKRAEPSRQGRSAIRGCSGGTGHPAAAPLHEGRGNPAFSARVRVRVAVRVRGDHASLHDSLSQVFTWHLTLSKRPLHAWQVKRKKNRQLRRQLNELKIFPLHHLRKSLNCSLRRHSSTLFLKSSICSKSKIQKACVKDLTELTVRKCKRLVNWRHQQKRKIETDCHFHRGCFFYSPFLLVFNTNLHWGRVGESLGLECI